MRARLLVLVAAALPLAACPGERSPFCSRWFQLDGDGREGEIREQIEDWREQFPGSGPAYARFMACAAGYVADRGAAVDSACRNFGDLEAGVTIGRLIAAGAEACAALPSVPAP
jgi:hypothetical protein